MHDLDDDPPRPYVVVIRFDKEQNLMARVAESGGRLVSSLKEIGPTQQIAMSYDGSMCAYLVTARGRISSVYARLEAPNSGKGSALKMHDCVGVFAIDEGMVPRFSKCSDWLGTHASPFRKK